MTDAVAFWAVLELAGLLALPVAAFLFARLPGRGLTLAKPLGLLLFSYPAWALASLGVAAPGTATLALGTAPALALGAWLLWRGRAGLRTLAARAVRTAAFRLWLAGEAVFSAGYAGVALLRAYSPDVWNTEKPMDMAFINAVARAREFPPHDPWLADETLNYYYYGHYVVAMLVRLAGVPTSVGFNLAVAAFYGLCAAAVLGVAAALYAVLRPRRSAGRGPLLAGLAAVVLALVVGNLAGGAQLARDGGSLRSYDWWSPSRVIDGTANEFPAFSFLLGDLHAHVMATPFTLVVAALALELATAGPRLPASGVRSYAVSAAELLLGALALGALYAVNAFDFPTGVALVAFSAGLAATRPQARARRAATVFWAVACLGLAVALFAPFWLDYSPATSGIGLVHERPPFTRFLADYALMLGLPLWVLAAPILARLRQLQITRGWTAAVCAVAAAALVLAAPARFAAVLLLGGAAALIAHAVFDGRQPAARRFFWFLVGLPLAMMLTAEVVYVRDAFDGTVSFRFNTVFKLGYQAWYLLAVAAGCVLVVAAGTARRRRSLLAWGAGVAVLAAVAAVYPVAASYSKSAAFERAPRLDGEAWLAERAPGDAVAIEWLGAHVDGAPVVLEAVGADFDPEGGGRVSTFTGLPAVVQWPGHEVQWNHDVGTRPEDADAIYRTRDLARARRLLARYDVRYVVVGSLERERYPARSLAKFERLGRRVFGARRTSVFRIGPP